MALEIASQFRAAPPRPSRDERKGTWMNPIHQSDLQKVLKNTAMYGVPGRKNGVWAKTVSGTAFHLRAKAIASGEPPPSPRIAVAHALQKETHNGNVVEFSKGTPDVRAMERHVEGWMRMESARPIRRGYGEMSFLLYDPANDVWYEGDADLICCGGLNPDLSIEWEIEDYKTGKEEPEPVTSPQHHLYSLALRYGIWGDAPHVTGVHLLNWQEATGSLYFGRWPRKFSYLWLADFTPGFADLKSLYEKLYENPYEHDPPFVFQGRATDGGPMNLDDSIAYIRDLTRRYLAEHAC